MQTGVVVAIIAAIASIAGACLSFVYSIKKDQAADWRKVKFENYREFMSALSGIAGTDATPENKLRFVQASNTIQLIASNQVIMALHEFRDEISTSNHDRSQDRHDFLLSKLLREIRFDLELSSGKNPPDLSIRLWVSGIRDA